MPIQSYRSNVEAEVLAASPLDLIRMLYRGAIQSVEKAQRHLERGEIKARSNQINRACMILAELQTAVDRETGGELAERLVALYDFAIRRLIDANVQQCGEPLIEVLGVLKTLHEAWENVSDLQASRTAEGHGAPVASYLVADPLSAFTGLLC